MRKLNDDHALVIFSGGQDSTTCLGWATKRYSKVTAITFVYGQKNEVEVQQAKLIANAFGVDHNVIEADFFGGIVKSALTSTDADLNASYEGDDSLPATFVPNRNAFFITLAHAYAQKIDAGVLVTGIRTDNSMAHPAEPLESTKYPDSQDTFIDAFVQVLNTGAGVNMKIEAPLAHISKGQSFALAEKEGYFDIVRDMSITCYAGDTTMHEHGMGCNECPSCRARADGYKFYLELYK